MIELIIILIACFIVALLIIRHSNKSFNKRVYIKDGEKYILFDYCTLKDKSDNEVNIILYSKYDSGDLIAMKQSLFLKEFKNYREWKKERLKK